MSFGDQVDKNIEVAKSDMREVFQATCIQYGTNVIKSFPVGEGVARSSVNASTDAPVFEYSKEDIRSDSQVIADIINVVGGTVSDVYYFSTGIPYVPVLEYGGYPNPPKKSKGKTVDGFSRQAPQGMFRHNAKLWPKMVQLNGKL